MKFSTDTDTEDYNVQTLLWMMRRIECWHARVEWKDWRFSWSYFWYDGPNWQLCLGPLWINIGY